MEQTRGKITATYPYQDVGGKLLYECLRIEPGRDGRKKDFRYRHPQPGGAGWVWNIEGVERVPYRLPDLLDPQNKGRMVLIVEGEGKVEALRKLGFLATCNPCGAGKWLHAYGRYLIGRPVAILADNDEPGWLHATQVAGNLLAWDASEIRFVHLPGLDDGGDVKDWLRAEAKAGTTRDGVISKLKGLVGDAVLWKRHMAKAKCDR